MGTKIVPTQDEKVLASLAHGSIILGVFTNGIGGIAAALIIWLSQRRNSIYVATQSLQALVYQTAIFLLAWLAFGCWGILWLILVIPSIAIEPNCCQAGPPPGIFAGLILLLCPFILWIAAILLGLWAGVRCLSGYDFKYPVIGSWLGQER